MNFKKVLNFLGLFILGINLLFTTEFAENLEAPKEIKEIFNDQVIAEKVSQMLGKSSTDAIVTQNELNSIRVFTYDGPSRVSNILGIQYLNNLSIFSVIDGEIIDLSPLSKLENLIYLKLSLNLIDDLKPLSRLKKLEVLDVSQNRIRDLSPLKSLKNLRELDVLVNPIANYKQLSNLEELRIKCSCDGYTPIPSTKYDYNVFSRFFRWIVG